MLSERLDYLKAVARQIADDGASRLTLREFQAGQQAAINKIMDDWENLDVFMNPSMDVNGMYVCISTDIALSCVLIFGLLKVCSDRV